MFIAFIYFWWTKNKKYTHTHTITKEFSNCISKYYIVMYSNHLSDVGLMYLGLQRISAIGYERQWSVIVQCTCSEAGLPGFAFQPWHLPTPPLRPSKLFSPPQHLDGLVCWAPDFSSGHDLMLSELKPSIRLCADSSEPGVCLWSLWPSSAHPLSVSLSKLSKH